MNKTKATYATGKRKCAIARVWVAKGETGILVNERTLEDYFPRPNLRDDLCRPLQIAGGMANFGVWATVKGGGQAGQAGALRHGIARALAELDPALRTALRNEGFITRDSRKKERKKYGQKGARKRFQYVKR